MTTSTPSADQPARDPHRTSSSKSTGLPPVLLTVLPLALVILFSYLTKNYQLDDALIYLRYIRNFRRGLGLTYNPGELFNGLTSPLFTYVTVLASYIFAQLQTAVIAISGICLFVAALLGASLFSSSKYERLLTSVVIASFGYFYSTFGMESSLFLMLIGLALYLYKIESRYFVVALSLVTITRGEGLLLATPMMLDYLIRHRKLPDTRHLVGAIIIFIAPLLFNYAYYGDFLAATGNAKIGQGKSGLWGNGWIFLDVKYLFDGFFSGSYLAVTFLACCFAHGAFRLRTSRLAIITLSFCLLLLSFYAGLNIPNYHWYYAPFFYVLLIVACHGFWQLTAKLSLPGTGHRRLLTLIPLSAGLLLTCSQTVSLAQRGRIESYAAIGSWLKDHTPPDASIAMVEIGTVGWYSDRKIIDILGLVNKYNADYIGKRDFDGWLRHYQPSHILRHDPAWPHEQSIAMLENSKAYLPVGAFQVPGYVLLERSVALSDRAIVDLVEKHKARSTTLDALATSSPRGAPYVMRDGDVLFAHAPSTVSFILKSPAESLSVSYGLKRAAQGKHKGVCFEIVQSSNASVLMSSCIPAATSGEELVQHRTVKVQGKAGDKLLLNTLCQSSCDHAWSYWSEFEVR